jgi:hypothetical protein
MRVKRDRENEMPMLPASLHKRSLLLICLALAVMSIGCATTSLDAPLPKDLSVEPPASDIPPHIAALSGIWTGPISSLMGRYVGGYAVVVLGIYSANSVGEYPARVLFSRRYVNGGSSTAERSVMIRPDGVFYVEFGSRFGTSRQKHFLIGDRSMMRMENTQTADQYTYAILRRAQ